METHRLAYRLLQWINDEIHKEHECFETAPPSAKVSDMTGALRSPEAARRWLVENRERLPKSLRCSDPPGRDLERLANHLGSTLHSHELTWDPPEERWGRYLHARRLGSMEKVRARERRRDHLLQLALDVGANSHGVDAMLGDAAHAERAAIVTYGAALIDRCNGVRLWDSTLALWRLFAWTPTGAPKRDFSLTADDVIAAECELVLALREAR